MGMNCPMPHQVAASGCVQSCCHDALPQGVALLSAGEKSKAARTMLFVPAAQMGSIARPVFQVSPPEDIVAAAPARYILFQVFRI
jgi:hypothetical protein